MSRVKTAVLVSGGGTNLQALLDAEKAGSLPQEQAGLIALECPALAKKLIDAGAAQPGTLSGGAYRPVLSALLLAL